MPESSPIRIRIPIETKKQLEAKASQENLTISDLVRRYIDKGLSIEGYKSEIDYLSDIIGTVLSGIIEPQIERLVKLTVKLGKINGAGYYLQLANLAETNKAELEELLETVSRCNKLAVRYMSQKDSDVERFLMNNRELVREALKLKVNPYGFDFSVLGGDADE